MPWELNGNNIVQGNFLGTTNPIPLEIRANGVSRLIIQDTNPIVSVPNANSWHHVLGNIIAGGIDAAFPITPFQGGGNIRAKSISAASDPGHPAPGPPAIGEITAQLITANRIVAPPTIDGRGGIEGRTNSWGWSGVFGQTNHPHGFGVYGRAVGGGWAAVLDGKVRVVGNLEKAGGGFKIDHPRDPADMYLNHSFVESSEMKNVYDGVERLDDDGAAWVELPEWFEALNKDFRYQLTAIGEAAPEMHVAEEISDNRFRIAGGKAGMKVCWQVSGIRSDPWAEANPMVVEENKPEEERGRYIQPDLYGAPEEQRIMRGLPITEAEVLEEEREDQHDSQE